MEDFEAHRNTLDGAVPAVRSRGNPAGRACLTDAAVVSDRFHIATVRRPLAS
jgi:hypothetical protein